MKRKLNENGVVDSNSVLFHFLMPSLFAAIFSAILQGVGQSPASLTQNSFSTSGNTVTYTPTTATYAGSALAGRDYSSQGGYQMAGWALSIGFGLAAGAIIGFIYKLLNDNFEEVNNLFNDAVLYEAPKTKEVENAEPAA